MSIFRFQFWVDISIISVLRKYHRSKKDNLDKLQNNLLENIWGFPTSATNTHAVIVICFITLDSFIMPWNACPLNPRGITIFDCLAGLDHNKKNINCKHKIISHQIKIVMKTRMLHKNLQEPYLITTSSWWAVEQSIFCNSGREFWLQYKRWTLNQLNIANSMHSSIK